MTINLIMRTFLMLVMISKSIHVFFVIGVIEEIIFESKMVPVKGHEFKKNEKFINGFADYKVAIREHIKPETSDMITVRENDNNNLQINFFHFPPGSVIAFR